MKRTLYTVLLLVTLGTGCSAPTTPDAARDRAIHFLSGAYDGQEFCDPYLRYRYAGEPLHFPYRRILLTHRHLDAFFLAAMLEEKGLAPGAFPQLTADAGQVLSALRREWRRVGFHNSRRERRPGGVGLDTFAILSYVTRDAALAGRLVESSDGEGWVHPDTYKGSDRFRRLADDSWALRALAVTGVAPELLESGTKAFLRDTNTMWEEALTAQVEANLLIHVLETEADLRASTLARETADEFARMASKAEARCRVLLEMEELRSSTLNTVNLALALLPRVDHEDEQILAARQTVLDHQAQDGSWRFDRAGFGADGVVFVTLRCLLFLLETA